MIERRQTPYAVINVDPQNDFCPENGSIPKGKLAVAEGHLVMPVLNEVNLVARRAGGLVVLTGDQHPEITTHFAKYGGAWPEHCVQGTEGAKFHPGLVIEPTDVIVSKGMGETEDAYSGFDARTADGKMLEQVLRERGVRKLLVGGLATDYCVQATVLDGLKKRFGVMVMENAVRAVNLQPEDGEKAWKKMQSAGAIRINSNIALRELLAMDALVAGTEVGKWLEDRRHGRETAFPKG